MSIDSTCVIAARRDERGRLEYTAAVIQCAEELFDVDPKIALMAAECNFPRSRGTWFGGRGALARAEKFAQLVTGDHVARGFFLEYYDCPIVELGHDRNYHLSRSGKREKRDAR